MAKAIRTNRSHARIAASLLAAAACLTVVGWAGRLSAEADLVNLFAPGYLIIGGLTAIIVLTGADRQRYAVLLLIALPVLVIAASRLVADLAPSARGGAVAGRLKIVTFNVWQNNGSPQRAADWILAQNADVVALIEAKGGAAGIPAALRAAYPHQHGCHAVVPCSTLVLTRVAPAEVVPLANGDAENRRALSAVIVRLGGDAPPGTIVVAVHLRRPFPYARQSDDLTALQTALVPVDRRRVVVAGDFNAVPAMATIRALQTDLDLRRAAIWLPTWPTGVVRLPLSGILAIDHILVGREWQIARLQRGPVLGSDHYPITATLVLTHNGALTK